MPCQGCVGTADATLNDTMSPSGSSSGSQSASGLGSSGGDGGSSSSGSATIPAAVCAPGATQSCLCSGSQSGVQICASSGQSWMQCQGCVPDIDAGPDDSGPADASMSDGELTAYQMCTLSDPLLASSAACAEYATTLDQSCSSLADASAEFACQAVAQCYSDRSIALSLYQQASAGTNAQDIASALQQLNAVTPVICDAKWTAVHTF